MAAHHEVVAQAPGTVAAHRDVAVNAPQVVAGQAPDATVVAAQPDAVARAPDESSVTLAAWPTATASPRPGARPTR